MRRDSHLATQENISRRRHNRPSLQRLYGSAAKQKFASFVILADRPFIRDMVTDEKEATVHLLKSRDGRQGKVKAIFNTKTLRFDDAAPEIDWRAEEVTT